MGDDFGALPFVVMVYNYNHMIDQIPILLVLLHSCLRSFIETQKKISILEMQVISDHF